MKKLCGLAVLACCILAVFTACRGNEEEKMDTPVNMNRKAVWDYDTEDKNADTGADEILPLEQVNAKPIRDFSLQLLKRTLESAEENTVISPLSAYFALSMAANGAEAETKEAFEQVLGDSLENINRTGRSIAAALSETAGSTVFHISNSAWIDTEIGHIYESYNQRIQKCFSAEINLADLQSDEAISQINAWVSERTNGMIEELLEEKLDKDTIMALLNAIYLKADWQNSFDPNSTLQMEFHKEDGTTVKTDFMRANQSSRQYIKTQEVEGILLPYNDEKLAFVALRPLGANTVSEWAGTLTSEQLEAYILQAKEVKMNLSIPKFSVECMVSMNDILKAMGLEVAFDPSCANFSNMGSCADGAIYIGDVLQKVRVDVDEKGTEAAAVTGILMMKTSALPQQPDVVLNLDSPYLYAIVDLQTNIPIFIGLMDCPVNAES